MTVGLSTTNTANAMLNALRNVSFAVAGTYCKLHTGDPGGAGTSAAAAGSTTRPQVTFAAASGGAIALTGTQPTWTNGGTSETVTHISVWDSATAGNLLWTAQLATSKSWASGDTLTLTSCGLSLSPLAS
jgi:hypothetical protein